MARAFDQLVAEIDRVVNSPYPTQLKVRVSEISYAIVHILKNLSNYIQLCVSDVRIRMSFNGLQHDHVKSMASPRTFSRQCSSGLMCWRS